jgi:hypothetical protein
MQRRTFYEKKLNNDDLRGYLLAYYLTGLGRNTEQKAGSKDQYRFSFVYCGSR